jgi:hypothetical protein
VPVRLAIDVCVTHRTELELWRAGYRIPVRAQNKEPDEAWLDRASNAGCEVAITADFGASAAANRRGMYSILVPFGTGGSEMAQVIMDGLEEVEERRTCRPSALLAPLAAVGLLLAACAPRPQVVEPPRVEAPYCFAVQLAWDGRTEHGQACGSTSDVCESVRRRAIRWGGVAGLRAVGNCDRRAP